MDFTCFGSFCSRRQTKYKSKSKAQFFNPSLLLCKAFTSVKISTYLVLLLVIIFHMRFLKTVTWIGLDWEAPDRKMFARSSRSFASSSLRQDSSKRSDQDLVLFTSFIKDEDVSLISFIAFPDNANALRSSPCFTVISKPGQSDGWHITSINSILCVTNLVLSNWTWFLESLSFEEIVAYKR